MQNITSVTDLKYAIQIQEAEQADHARRLKEQFHLTLESIKPINLIKNALNEVATSPWLIENIIGTSLGIASGYFSKRLVVGGSANILRKIAGSVLQFGVTNLITQHPDALKSFGKSVFKQFSRSKARKSGKEEQVEESAEI